VISAKHFGRKEREELGCDRWPLRPTFFCFGIGTPVGADFPSGVAVYPMSSWHHQAVTSYSISKAQVLLRQWP
jgi:hypothetical protein